MKIGPFQLLIIALVQRARGGIVPALNRARPLPPDRRAFVEGFAFYLGLFAVLGLAARALYGPLPQAARILALAALPIAFLVGVLWPLLRGQCCRLQMLRRDLSPGTS